MLAEFTAATHDLLKELAIVVAKDGEGCRKFVTLTIEEREDDAAARRIGLSVAQLAAGQDRDRRRGPELGPRRHGRRQVGRGGGPRQPLDPVRRHAVADEGRARGELRRADDCRST